MLKNRENEIYELAFNHATKLFFNFENLPEKMELKVEIVEQILTFLEEETELSDHIELENWIKDTNYNLRKMNQDYRKVIFSVTPNLEVCIQHCIDIKMRFLEIYSETLKSFQELESKYDLILTKATDEDSNLFGKTFLAIL